MGGRLGLLVLAAVCAAVATSAAPPPLAAAPSTQGSPPLKGVNFISVCGFSHRGTDDPIVYPDMPGISHDHTFVGNISTNAHSTFASLRAAGTTCSRAADTAAYWAPTLFVAGTPVTPIDAIAYYRRLTDKKLRPFPPGLKMVAGNSHAFSAQSVLVTYWDCGNFSEVKRSGAVPDCSGSALRLTVNFPDCWNGKSLDSSDHRSHMAYSRGGKCPKSHGIAVPALQLVYRYAIAPDTKPADVYLASGGQYSGHADFINAWDQAALAKLVGSCLNRLRHCGTGSS